MESLEDILGRLLTQEGGLFAQVFSVEDITGIQHHFNATKGMRIARESGEPRMVSLVKSGITPETVRAGYTGLDEAYAMTTDTRLPVLFVPHNGKDLCIDGWHRIFRAASVGQEWIPAYFLTEEQTESIKILTLPPEQGFDWGQRAKAR
jgi:hypothetical protein